MQPRRHASGLLCVLAILYGSPVAAQSNTG
jgi:hypothetical protein